MKKIIIAFLLICLISSPCYALNPVDRLLCKRVLLCANRMSVLVQRITGEVKYVLLNNGKWMQLVGVQKAQFQSMYNAQVALKIACR